MQPQAPRQWAAAEDSRRQLTCDFAADMRLDAGMVCGSYSVLKLQSSASAAYMKKS
jgi:hypothetical protein